MLCPCAEDNPCNIIRKGWNPVINLLIVEREAGKVLHSFSKGKRIKNVLSKLPRNHDPGSQR
jgi:hypothetical protein